MKRIIFLCLLLVCGGLTGNGLRSQAQALASATPSKTASSGSLSGRSVQVSVSPRVSLTDRVLVEAKTVTFVRGKKGQEYPNYKEAIVQYPQVSGLADPAVLRNVQAAVSLKSVMGQSLDELRTEFQETWWLSEIGYTVNYNQNSLFDITFTISGLGAYPSSYDKHRTISLKTGKVLKAADVFKRESLGAIAMMVDREMQAEIKQAIAKAGQDGADIRDRLTNKRFQSRNLNSFTVSDKGITFLYDFDFPHVMLALQPSGKYFLGYDQLKAHIKPKGALGVFLPNAAAGIRS